MRPKTLFFILMFAGTVFYLFANTGAAPAEKGFSWVSAVSSTGANLTSVAYGKDLFAAVGENGIIETSTDGVKWTKRDSGVNDSFRSIVHNGSIFAAVGSNGTILTSENGIAWTKEKSGVNVQFNSIIWDGKQFIIAGREVILVSADGKSWSQCLPESVTDSGVINGETYTNRILMRGVDIYSVVSCGGLYTAVGNIPVAGAPVPQTPNIVELYSADGKNWTGGIKSHRTTTISKIVSKDGIYVALGSTTEHRTQLLTSEILSGGAKPQGTILTSDDGVGWIKSNMIGDYRDIACDGKNFVVVGKSAIFESSDGINWSQKWTDGVPVGAVDRYVIFNGVACGKTKCVAVGNNGVILNKAVAPVQAAMNGATGPGNNKHAAEGTTAANGSTDGLHGGTQAAGAYGAKAGTVPYTATTRALMTLLLISLLTMAGLSATLIYKIITDMPRKQKKKDEPEEKKAEEGGKEEQPDEKEKAESEQKEKTQESGKPENAASPAEKPKAEGNEELHAQAKPESGKAEKSAAEGPSDGKKMDEAEGKPEETVAANETKSPDMEASEPEKSAGEQEVPVKQEENEEQDKEAKEGTEPESSEEQKDAAEGDAPVKWVPEILDEKKETEESETVKAEEPEEVKPEEPMEVKAEEPAEIKAQEPEQIKAEEPEQIKTEEPEGIKAEEPAEIKVEESEQIKDMGGAEPVKKMIEEIELGAPEIILEEKPEDGTISVSDKEDTEKQEEKKEDE